MVKSIIESLPENHFGEITKKTISSINKCNCISVYGLPGYGMDFFSGHITNLLSKKYPEFSLITLNLQFHNDKLKVLHGRLGSLLGMNDYDETDIKSFLQENKVVVILSETRTHKYPDLFKELYSLRSMNRRNFVVLTVGDYKLFKNNGQYTNLGKIIFSNTKLVPNFSKKGIERIIKLNNKFHSWDTPTELLPQIYKETGGNPALVKYLCQGIYEEGEEILNYPQKLINLQPLNLRISDIADLIPILDIEEQKHIGLLNDKGEIFAGLVKKYLKYKQTNKVFSLLNLTNTQERLLEVFINNSGEIINKDQISIILNQSLDEYSEWAIYKAVERLREKIEDTDYHIYTIRGKGWVLKR